MWGRNKTNWYVWHVEVYLFGWPFQAERTLDREENG